jgi:pathogenesis-related protein 1
MKFKLLILSLLFAQLCIGQSRENTGSRISQTDAQKFLVHHNQVRAEVGVPGLTWSIELSAYAQEWADYLAKNNGCKMEHRKKPNLKGEPLGENLFWGSSSTYYHPIDASTSWYEEKKIYKYGKFGQGNWHAIGHYTQMVWKNTKEVGVGVAICKNGELMVVASYYPAGNFLLQFPY